MLYFPIYLLAALFTSVHATSFLNAVKELLSLTNPLPNKFALNPIKSHIYHTRPIDAGSISASSFKEIQGTDYEEIRIETLKNHTLRLSLTNKTLCDPTVKQNSGYLDTAAGKHLFFWYFEARNSPDTAPLLLWLNGGPGCSSSIGLLNELGPCSIRYNAPVYSSPYTEVNPYSWTTHSNVIFLDQPAGVGFSYVTDNSTIDNSATAAKDVYAFLQLFFAKYPKLLNRDFHVAAESHGGVYAPHVGKVIHDGNQNLKRIKLQSPWTLSAKDLSILTDFRHVPLNSIILANGQTDPYIQYATVPEIMCYGPYAPWKPGSLECQDMYSKASICQHLLKSCYESGSRFDCVNAGIYCDSQLTSPVMNIGLNPYDLRRRCEGGMSACYKETSWISEWLNEGYVKNTLGVPKDIVFNTCNPAINEAFMLQGDGARNTAALLPPLLQDGVRLLVYAGNTDAICNYIGNFKWMFALSGHPYVLEFRNATTRKWHLPFSNDPPALRTSGDGEDVRSSGKVAGEFRAAHGGAKGGAGKYVFVNVYEAGHLVPYDQPEVALDLIRRWLKDEAFD